MNINLSKAVADAKANKKKTKATKNAKSIGFGLNHRGGEATTKNKNDVTASTGGVRFDDNSSNDSDVEDQKIGSNKRNDKRKYVNQAIVAEQAALRKRAQVLLHQTSSDSNANDLTSIYDYDGVYDTMHPSNVDSNNGSTMESVEKGSQKSSRYIEDLLKTAEQRKREREIIHDRKIVLEQEKEAEELGIKIGSNDEEKYITAAYKKQLQERELWIQEQKQLELNEISNDITKRDHGGGINTMLSGFYGNINRNVAVGRGLPDAGTGAALGSKSIQQVHETKSGDIDAQSTEVNDTRPNNSLNSGDLDSPKRSAAESLLSNSIQSILPEPIDSLKGKDTVSVCSSMPDNNYNSVEEGASVIKPNEEGIIQSRKSKREIREQNIIEARNRFFQRHGVIL